MAYSVSLTIRPKPLRHLNTVAVCAKKNLGSNEKFERRRKAPRKRDSSESGDRRDISALHDDYPVPFENISGLLVDCNKRIDVYVKSKNLSAAEKLLKLMIKRNVDPDIVTYNTIMNGYSKAKNSKRVFELFDELEIKRVTPSTITFGITIRTCAQIGDIRRALSLFEKMKKHYRLKPDKFTYSALLKVCASAKDLKEAQRAYEEIISFGIEVNNVILNTMIDVYAECCNERNGKQYLKKCKEMMENGKAVKLDEQAYSTLLKLCARANLTGDAMNLLDEMKSYDVQPNVVSYNTVVDGISKDTNLSNEEVYELSTRVIEKMESDEIDANNHTLSSLLNVMIRVENLEKAIQLFSAMEMLKIRPNNVTYGAMLKCYEKLGNPSDKDAYLKPCLDLWKECEHSGTRLNAEGYTTLLSACAKASNVDEASKIWDEMIRAGVKLDTYLYSAMINACVCGGDKDKAAEVFNDMKNRGFNPDTFAYTTVIKCYEKLGDPSDKDAYLKPCLDLWKECELKGIRLNTEGYTSLLNACARVSCLGEAERIWNKILEKKVNLNTYLYAAMINCFLSIEKKDRAFELVNKMNTSGMKPDEETYGKFLSHFVKMKDESGSEQIHDQMQMLGVRPDEDSLKF